MSSTIVLGVAAVFLAAHLATVLLALAHLGRRPAARFITGSPRITLLRPVTGSDPLDRETLATSFRQDWPDYEVIFCAPSDSDPAVALVRALIAENPHVPARLLTGQERITGNPKLDNLWKGWEGSDAPWVCMADSNLLLPPDYLTTLVRCWDERAGLVSSPACGIRPDGLAARIEAAFLNGNQGRLQLAAAAVGRGFAQGKTLFWNRDMLEGAGGLRSLGRWLAEDVAATRLVTSQGRKVRLAPRPFPQPLGRRRLKQVWDRQLRWDRVRRDGFPLVFAAEILVNGAFFPALLALIGGGWLAFAGVLLVWIAAEWILCRRAGWSSGPADIAAMLIREALLPALWVTAYMGRGINWRGNDMQAPAKAEPGP